MVDGLRQQGVKAQMAAYVYQTLDAPSPQALIPGLNHLSEEGWELVSVCPVMFREVATWTHSCEKVTAFLRRPKPNWSSTP